nr:hypothetical protein [Micromonospora sp. DSM 115978]
RDAVRAVGVAVVLWQAFLGAVLIGRWSRYSEPETVFAIWFLTSAALGGCVVTALRRRLPSAPSAPSVPSAAVAGTVVAVVVGQAAAGLAGQASDPIPLNWAMLSMYGVVAFLTVAGPPRQWLPASVVVGTSAVIVTLGYLGSVAEVVTYVGTYLYLQVVIQLLVGGIGPLRRQTAQATMRVARAEAELAADLRAAAVVRRDRRDRLRRLRIEALPLLAAVGDGELDPASDEVRRRSRRCATTLRRTLQDTHGSVGLLGGIEVAVRAAEARGVCVVTQVAGTVGELPDAAQAEVVRAVSQVLDGIPDGRAVLTVTGDSTSGSVFVAFVETEPERDSGVQATAPLAGAGSSYG